MAKRFKHVVSSIVKHSNATKLARVPQQFQHGGICDNASFMREPNMFDTPGQTNQTNMRTKERFHVV